MRRRYRFWVYAVLIISAVLVFIHTAHREWIGDDLCYRFMLDENDLGSVETSVSPNHSQMCGTPRYITIVMKTAGCRCIWSSDIFEHFRPNRFCRGQCCGFYSFHSPDSKIVLWIGSTAPKSVGMVSGGLNGLLSVSRCRWHQNGSMVRFVHGGELSLGSSIV